MESENKVNSISNKADSKTKKDNDNHSTLEGNVDNTKAKAVSTNAKKPSNYFILISGILLAVLIPAATFAYIKLVYLPKLEDEKSAINQEKEGWKLESTEATGLLAECKSELKACNPDADVLDEIESKSTRFELDNGKYIDIPADWYVKGFNVDFKYMSLDEQADSGIAEINQGFWPLYQSSELVLANGSNVVSFINYAQHIAGPAGFIPSEFTQEEYLVLQEPTDDTPGAVRYADSGSHAYARIIENPDFEDPEGLFGSDYPYLYDSLPYGYSFEYTGSADYLEVVDELYMDACVQNTSGWCVEMNMGDSL